MKRVLTTWIAAAAVAVLMGSLVSAESRTVPVNVEPAASIEVLLFTKANEGKSLVVTGPNGKGNIQIDVAEVANLGKLIIIQEKCPDRTRVLLVAAGNEPQSNCNKKVIGFWLVNGDTPLNIHLAHGMSVVTKAVYASAAGVGGWLALEKFRSRTDKPVVTENKVVIPPPITTTTTTTTNLTSANGTYSGTSLQPPTRAASRDRLRSEACSLLTATGAAPGRRRTSARTSRSASTSRSRQTGPEGSRSMDRRLRRSGRRPFNISDVATISGKVMTITQTFTSTSGETCTVRYTGQISRS